MQLSNNLAISLLGIYPREKKILCLHKSLLMMYGAPSFLKVLPLGETGYDRNFSLLFLTTVSESTIILTKFPIKTEEGRGTLPFNFAK
jgi:hypothetical protein